MPSGGGGGGPAQCPQTVSVQQAAQTTFTDISCNQSSLYTYFTFPLMVEKGEGSMSLALHNTHSTITEYLNLDSDLMSVSDMAQICTFRHHANILKCLPPSPAIMALQHSDTKMGASALCQLFF